VAGDASVRRVLEGARAGFQDQCVCELCENVLFEVRRGGKGESRV